MNRFLKLQLHALQLEGYDIKRYLKWWFENVFTLNSENKKPLEYTLKVKLLIVIWWACWLVSVVWVINTDLVLGMVYAFGMYIWPVPILLISIVLLYPIEWYERGRRIKFISSQVKSMDKLRVVGITGSFGKTSTKDFLYEMLNQNQYSLKTPESYNTDLGIYKAVQMELNTHHKNFVCEMGAFGSSEIMKLCDLVNPRYGILTSIGPQHLDRFGSVKNITKAKFELVDYVDGNKMLVNIDNHFISDELKKRGILDKVKSFSLSDNKADFWVSEYTLGRDGMRFIINENVEKHLIVSTLFGTSNLKNLVAAIGMARMLKVSWEEIDKAVARIKPSTHRLELKKINESILIDNAYSSNAVGFKMVMDDLRNVKGKKALITPGLVELGDEAEDVHMELGQIAAGVFDEIFLVGKSKNTKHMKKGIQRGEENEIKFQVIPDNHEDISETVSSLSQIYDWILLENDLTDTQA